jgi:hypothetical protein
MLQQNKAGMSCEKHEWVVFSSAIDENWLMLQCVCCGLHGTVRDPSLREWSKAFRAPSRPYRWTAEGRVHIQAAIPRHPPYVMRTVAGPRCECYAQLGILLPREYERTPGRLIRPRRSLSMQEQEALLGLASFIRTTDLCSLVFPVFIEHCDDKPTLEIPSVIREIARDFAKLNGLLHFSAQVVARTLTDYATSAK